jgi:acetyl-CoA synthetase/medium-chain acyl-CoA synthetase
VEAVKGLRIGRRRGREAEAPLSPLELALRPALVDGRWQIPDRFNFTRDVVEALARDPKRRALTFLGSDGVIEPRTFLEISEGATVWAVALRELGVGPSDRVVLMAGSTVDWLEALLGIWKVGAVVVPCLPSTTSSQLERLVSSTDAALVVAERSLEQTIERMGFTPEVHLYDEGVKRSSKDVPTGIPTHDTLSRDLAFVVSTGGVGGARKHVAHTHGSVFATRVQAEHWLDVGRGDTVWCTAESSSPLTMWNTVVGPWSRGAEIALQHGGFDVDERLDLLFRLGPSILCQSPAEYRALAAHPKLERFRSPRLRRLVATGDVLDPETVAVFEERWGLSIADGYGQAETNIVIANLADGPVQPGSLGRALPGHHVAIIDDQGNELPPGVEGDLAVRGRPPTLFAGYWELPEETKSAFLGDWYLTGDVAQADEEGSFTFLGRAEDVISSSGRTFGPYDVEHVLDGHEAIAATAVVGMRDLQRGGHFVRAFVVAKSPDGGSEQLEAELRQYASQTLPTHQVPREIVFVDALPTVGWKISRHELRERPLEGRPLWELPPTTEPDEAVKPAPPPFDAEFSPRIDPLATPEPSTAFVPERELPAPNVPAPAPVAEPGVAAAPPPPVASPPPAPVPVVEPEPVVPEPVADMPPVVDAPADPQPPPAIEPAPPVAEALPLEEPEPAVVPGEPEPPVAGPTPEPEPVPPIAEALPETVPEPDPVVEASPDPAPEPPPIAVAPVAAAPVEPAPPQPAARVPEPEPALASAQEPIVVEPEPALPDYVIDRPDGAPPVVIPESEPEPDMSGPPPEYVVEPSASEPPPVAPLGLAPDEDEEDLGPLPDFVIDPDDPDAAKRIAPPPPPPEPEPILAPRAKSPVEEPPASPALNFPSSAAFSIPRRESNDSDPTGGRVPRPRLQAEPGSKRPAGPVEPGDESTEVGWMDGLSNRLNAYGFSEDEQDEPASDDDTRD